MRSDDDGVETLESEHCVAHRGNDRVGAGCDGADDSDRARDLCDSGLLVAAEDADGLFALQAVPDDLCLALVLLDLVLVNTHPRLIDGKTRKILGVVVYRLCAGSDYRVSLLL